MKVMDTKLTSRAKKAICRHFWRQAGGLRKIRNYEEFAATITLEDVAKLTKSEWLQVQGIGIGIIAELEVILTEYGLYFKE